MSDVQKVTIRLKKGKIKINAALSALCNMMGLIPTKVLTELNKISESLEPEDYKFFVELTSENSEFKVSLLKNSDALVIKKFLKTSKSDQQLNSYLHDYAKSTLNKTLAKSFEKRLAELKGIVASFNKI